MFSPDATFSSNVFVSIFIEFHFGGPSIYMSSFSIVCDLVTLFCSPQRQTSPCLFLGARRCGTSSITFVLVSLEKDLEKVQAVYLEQDSRKFHQCRREVMEEGKKGNKADTGGNSKQLPTVDKEQPTSFHPPRSP